MILKPHLAGPDNALPADADTRKDSLIEYPSQFPIKVMGVNVDGFAEAITALAQRFDPAFDPTTAELRHGSGGKYLGVTVTITAAATDSSSDGTCAARPSPIVSNE